MSEKIKIISLGWGVQSFTLAAMSALGEIEHIDAAISADTRHERQATYRFAERWTPWLRERGIEVVTVSADDTGVINKRGGFMLPAHMWIGDRPAAFNRQCTQQWKRAPIRKYIQTIRNKKFVEQWIGISLDEWKRMKDNDVQYITNRWPLVEKRMTRADCITWLINHAIETPPKSSCIFCPFHNTIGWREMKTENGDDWKEAIEMDKAIRKARPPYDLYLHSSGKPLSEIDLRTPQEKGQLELWANFDAECAGTCGI